MTPDAPVLRPMGVGDIIDRTFHLVRERWTAFVILAAVPQLAFSIASRLAGFGDPESFDELVEALQPTATSPDLPADALASVARIGIVVTLIAVVVFVIQAGALVELAAARYLGRDLTVGEAARRAIAAAPRLIGAGILSFGGLLAALAAATAVIAVLGVVLGLVGGGLGSALVPVLLAGGAIAGLAVFGYLTASWLVAPVAVMVERAGPLGSLRRSWQLSRGARWRVLALILLVLVLQVVLSALFSVLFLAAFAAEPLTRTVLQEAANVAAVAIASSIQWGAFTVLYYDLRVRREALDLQMAAEQLAREP